MRRRRWVIAGVLALGAVVVTTAALGAETHHADPRKAAAALVRSLGSTYRNCHKCGSFGVTKVIHRNGHLWLGVAAANQRERELVLVYRWERGRWQRVADVRWRGWGGTQFPTAASLTGSADPDFAIGGCGAGDTNCLSVVSDVGGRWHVVPFEYGYGRALVVNGIPQGDAVQTAVDACGCAGGPTTFLTERYARGAFRPARPPGKDVPCSRLALEFAADEGTVPTFQFDRVACRSGWALAVGTGAGFEGHVVGLFSRSPYYTHPRKWRLLTLDNGFSLPAAPTLYDLPRSLLTQLAQRLGPSFTPMVTAAHLISRLQHTYHFDWQQVAGIVRAKGEDWLVAVVPAHPGSTAIVYRWTGNRWAEAGRVPRLHGFYAGWGGWTVSFPATAPGAVAFARAGSYDVGTPRHLSKTVITNAGGRWHIMVR